MTERSEFTRTDILNKREDAHRDLETMKPEDVRAVLAEAIETIRTLRILSRIKGRHIAGS